MKQSEVNAIRIVIKEFVEAFPDKRIDLVFVCVNKLTNLKMYFNFNDNNNDLSKVKSPLQGTMLGKGICSEDDEFFLVSQMGMKGLATPSNYYILENDLIQTENKTAQDSKLLIAKLSFKLCFLYYNTVGGIKSPAPVHYAHKLSSFINDNQFKGKEFQPHCHLQQINSLYFI